MYLIEQIKSGANIVKIFESWAGLLDNELYSDFIIKPNKKILENIKMVFPIFRGLFSRRSELKILQFIENVDCDILPLMRIF